MANVFVSYARRDRERVVGLVSALEHEGLSVWWDPNLVPGKRFRDIIARELDAADSVVVVWSAASIQSDYVQDEAEEARERGVLVPVTLEPVKPPAGFRQVQAADLSQWTGNGEHPEFRILLSAVQTLVKAAQAELRGAGPTTPVSTSDRAPPPPIASPQAESPDAASPAPPSQPDLFMARLFDLFALPAVWVTAAILVTLSGLIVGFGLAGTAAAMVLWAGATAQAAAALGPHRKMMVMVTALGVALIVGASTHSSGGVVIAILVGSVILAGYASIALAAWRGSQHIRVLRDARGRPDYRAYAAEIRQDALERRQRRRARRTKSGGAPG